MTHVDLAFIPSPPQGVWFLGPVAIRAYSLCILTGVLIALWWSKRRYQRMGHQGDDLYGVAVAVILGGIVGGRLYHVITQADDYFCSTCNTIDALKITNGGLGIIGAVAVGALAVWGYTRYAKISFGDVAEAVAPTILVAQAVGRLGNWFNQELYGYPTTVPWGLEIFNRVDDTGHYSPLFGHSTGEVLSVVHPTFLYEALWNLCAAALLVWLQKKLSLRRGESFALYFAVYGVGRFVVELMRSDPAHHIMGLRVNTVTSTLLVIGGCAVTWWLHRRHDAQDAKRHTRDVVTQ